ncbi:MAG: hypothetical protein II547_07775 [Treponema sp.]|jgi:hypothetical protein|nr:hypothetical protein [Treponema sp.]
MTVESKSVVAQCPQEKLYDFLSDFNNIAPLAPAGAIEQCTADSCTVKVGGFIQLTITCLERVPYSRIVVGPAANSSSPVPFRMEVGLQPEGVDATRVGITVNIDGGNPMMTMMLKPKLKDAVDMMADKLQYFASGIQ